MQNLICLCLLQASVLLILWVNVLHTMCSSANCDRRVILSIPVFSTWDVVLSSATRPFPGITVSSLLPVGIPQFWSKVSSKLCMEEEGGRTKLLVGRCKILRYLWLGMVALLDLDGNSTVCSPKGT